MLSTSSRSWLRSLLQRRYLLPVLAFGGPLVAIAFVQYRWLEELHAQSMLIDSQRNREAAVSAVSALGDAISGARLDTLPAVVHADVLELRLDALAREFDDSLKRYPYVDRFFAWAAPAPPGDTLFYFPEETRFRQAPDLIARMPPEVWVIHVGGDYWAEFSSVRGNPPYQIVVHRLLKDDESSLEGIVGFMVNLETFAHDYLPRFHAEHLVPLFRNMSGEETLPVSFFDEKGQRLFGTEGSAAGPLSGASVEFHLSFATPSGGPAQPPEVPHWRLSVGEAQGGAVEEILKRGAFGNLAIVGAGILVLTLGTLLIARTSAREAQLSDLKSRFISGISHELKTPLSLIRLYSEMLELGRVPDESERKVFYRTLRQQADVLDHTLEQVLDFSRHEAEQQVLLKELCQPKEILEEAVEMLTTSSPERQVSLCMEPDLPELDGDRRSLVRVIYNLLDNAAKYSPPDQPIDVRATPRDGRLAVEITDRGTGISAEELPHIFDRFYRARPSRGIRGTGLGLSIAQAVVKAHHGKIQVESKPGEGSRFTVILPTSATRGKA